MNGTGNGTTFSPSGTMSRSMIATVLYRIAGQPSHSGNNPFTDINTGWYYDAFMWAYDALAWANAVGLITGAVVGGQTVLNPRGTATRELVTAILMRFCQAYEE